MVDCLSYAAVNGAAEPPAVLVHAKITLDYTTADAA